MSKPDLVKMLEEQGFIPKELEVRIHQVRLEQQEHKQPEHEHYQRQLPYQPTTKLYLQRLQHG